jgi:hypothetical protein
MVKNKAGEKDMDIVKLRKDFKEYFQTRYPNDNYPDATVSMAFYICNHENELGCNFQNIIKKGIIPENYRNQLQSIFENNGRKNPKSDSYTYERALRLLLEYVNNVEAKRISRKQITNQDLDSVVQIIQNDFRYGVENDRIDTAFKKFKSNTDEDIIAMKIALVDMTNSTNLNKHLGKIGLNDMIHEIMNINFDERVQQGDISLVSELTHWSKKQGVILFSFFSKYCLYHNYHCYERDDYSIFDSVVKEHLKDYNEKFIPNRLDKLRLNCDYEGYMSCIDMVIKDNSLTTKNVRRKLDWYIWYNNRGIK